MEMVWRERGKQRCRSKDQLAKRHEKKRDEKVVADALTEAEAERIFGGTHARSHLLQSLLALDARHRATQFNPSTRYVKVRQMAASWTEASFDRPVFPQSIGRSVKVEILSDCEHHDDPKGPL
ncbi:hypothetical protein PHSY_002091 [Pseudozyma hubeiensis SY62]|uniref:Uncharacterized protein n=1 Tax=Pseudozyma hubeiensis (strain SY62) TaxID=1305764 RepID=R9P0A8_PSEHS|nr:hypothetical protein PHSY_002091 [Pseudozyma hubeiensis SY62]GAC94519.1 hypothetical protein PHSY_002091 [Pseudozyma hubeiensis SY62]